MSRWLCILICIASAASPALAAEPLVKRINPHGGQRGTALKIVLRGERLADAQEILFDRPGIEVTEFKAVNESKVEATLQISEACPLGAHGLRLRTSSGIAPLKLLLVGALPETSEAEPNNTIATANPIALNTTVNGVADNEDLDVFAFEGRAGQRVSAEVEGIRLGMLLFDSYVAILDAQGFELATCDDRTLLRQDASVSVILPENGTYLVQVRESSYAGNGKCVYRLHVGDFPRPTATLPLGGKPGETLDVALLGTARADQTASIALPEAVTRSESSGGWMKPAVLGVHIEDAAGIAPSPNYLRVVDLDNTIELEPNNSHEKATPVTLPQALNGVLSEDGDQDCYEFHAKGKERFLFVVFARQLRTPVDAVLRIHAKGGRQLASNDDSIGPDSVIDFTAPEDGDYVVTIHDHLRKGGPDFAYRIEVWPTPRALAGQLPKNAEFIAVPRGNRVASLVTATRFNVGGDVTLGMDSLPAGVSADLPAMNGAVNKVPIVLEAAADAVHCATMSDLTLAPVDESIKLILPGRLSQDVELVLGRNNIPYMCHSIDRVPVVVVDEAPFTIELVEPKAPLVRNGSMNLAVRVQRSEGFDKSIRLRVPWTPAGVGASQSIKIAPGDDTVHVPINANANAQLGSWPVVVTAEVGTDRGTVRVSSQLIQVQVAEPFVVLNAEPATVEQGQAVEMFATLTRVRPFDGPATIRLGGLPNKVQAPTMDIPPDQAEVAIELATAPESPAGRHKNVFCIATITVEGEPVVHRLGWAELRIDAPLPEAIAVAPPPPPKAKPEAKAKPKRLTRLEKLRAAHEARKAKEESDATE